jgi:hypothetical protein
MKEFKLAWIAWKLSLDTLVHIVLSHAWSNIPNGNPSYNVKYYAVKNLSCWQPNKY